VVATTTDDLACVGAADRGEYCEAAGFAHKAGSLDSNADATSSLLTFYEVKKSALFLPGEGHRRACIPDGDIGGDAVGRLRRKTDGKIGPSGLSSRR
jgi:hypothetical protein